MKQKNTLRKLMLGAFLSAILLPGLSSCIKTDIFPCIEPVGEVITEERILFSEFHALDLRMHGRVTITESDSYSLKIHAAPNLLPEIITRVSAGELVIDTDHCIQSRSSDILIEISTPVLEEVKISGSGLIFINDAFESELFEIRVSGSGSISGELYGQVLEVYISGSGKTDIQGMFPVQDINISGSGEVQHRNLICHDTRVNISGSGNAFIFSSDFLDASISGSGNIFYWGNPEISSTISGSGRIFPLN